MTPLNIKEPERDHARNNRRRRKLIGGWSDPKVLFMRIVQKARPKTR